MDTMLINRDHAITPAGRPYAVTGTQELLQRVLIRLTVPRGRFAPDAELGSRLYRMPRASAEQMEAFARYAIEEALCGLDWVRLISVAPTLAPDGERVTLQCSFALGGSAATLVLEV